MTARVSRLSVSYDYDKSKEERTEVISRLLFTFVTHKLQEHLNFLNTFSYLLNKYDVTSLENIHSITF